MPGTRDRIGLTFLERLPLAAGRPLIAYGFAIVASLAALLLRSEIDGALPPGFPYLTFFPAVIVTAFLFGWGPGLLSAILCGLSAWYWFIPPAGWAISYAAGVALGFYILIVTVDIALVHWMQRANGHFAVERHRANALADTRETLFKELQHRVGNNLQMVASLLSLQSRGVGDGPALSALTDASRRIALVGRIQRTLYSPEGEQLALAPYIEAIARDTIEASGRSDIVLRFANGIGAAQIEPSSAIPAALTVAEAVSNAIEHGFAARAGTIDLAIADGGSHYRITIADDGRGLADGFDCETSQSLGLRIARSLSANSGGSFDVRPRDDGLPGTLATIHLARG